MAPANFCKRRVRVGRRSGSHYFRDNLGSVDGVWLLVSVAFFRFTCKFAFMYLQVTFK